MYAVIINEGPMSAEDNALYFCRERPEIVTDIVFPNVASREAALDKEVTFKWVRFTPINGGASQRDKPHQVPFERLVAIIES